MSTSQYLRSIGASSEWVTHDSPTPCTIRESDTVWVLVYCSPSMMHKIGAICTHPMRFALSSIREENCNADRATTTTTPYREHATCGTLICCSNSSYQEWPPLCVLWSFADLCSPSRGRLQTENCMRHMHKVWTVNCINGHSFCPAEWVYSSYTRIRIRSSHSGTSNGATFNWMNKRHLIELRLCSQCVSLALTAFLHTYTYVCIHMCMYMYWGNQIYAECWRLFRLYLAWLCCAG